MLDRFQREVLRILASNRDSGSYVGGGSALNRDNPRLSRDIDVFHKTVALIDKAVASDLKSLQAAGLKIDRVRETSTMREWVIANHQGEATKVQWTRDTSWLFFPPLPDEEFGFVLSFEDLAVNKLAAAADRGRRRDYHDLACLDLVGVSPWVLALAAMGKDAEFSPLATLERSLRLLKDAGEDDEDPEYVGPSISWSAVRRRMSNRLRENIAVLDGFRWSDWAGCLPLNRSTGRLALKITPADLSQCDRGRASPNGSWPTTLASTTEMLRFAKHPNLSPLSLDLTGMEEAWLDQGLDWLCNRGH